jgi:hypothetical protein
MKLNITLIALGVVGVLQYIYFQFTPLALKYSYEMTPDPEFGEFGLINLETSVTRDWMLGIIPALVGVCLLVFGVVRLALKRNKIENKTD